MSYKVSSIITPFCRNLLAPAMALAFFVTSDDGLRKKLLEACFYRMIASTWSHATIAAVKKYAQFGTFSTTESGPMGKRMTSPVG